MKRYSKTIRGVTTIGIALLIALLAYGYLRYTVGAMESDIVKRQAALDAATAADKSAEAAEALLTGLQDKKTKLSAMFLDDDTLVSFLSTIENLSKTTGGAVKVLSVSNSPDKQSYLLSVSAEGKWQAVYQTLSLIETLPIPVSINNVQILHEKGTTATADWQGLFDFSIAKSAS
jgi:hypothetical protein